MNDSPPANGSGRQAGWLLFALHFCVGALVGFLLGLALVRLLKSWIGDDAALGYRVLTATTILCGIAAGFRGVRASTTRR